MTIANKVSAIMIGAFSTAVTSGVASYLFKSETKKTEENKEQRNSTNNNQNNSVSGIDVSDWGSGWTFDNSTGLL